MADAARGPLGRHQPQPRALQGIAAGHLGEAQVVADAQPHRPPFAIQKRQAFAGLQPLALAHRPKQVQLAVDPAALALHVKERKSVVGPAVL